MTSTNDVNGTTSPFIKFVTLNILSGRNGRLEMALREMNRMNADLGILTEAKLTAGVYTRGGFGYRVLATDAVSPHKGGIAFFWRERPNWTVESQACHGPNVISFELVTGGRRSLVIGAYISPSETDGSTLAAIEAAKARRPGLRSILLGDLNVDLQEPQATGRTADIIGAVASMGLDNLVDHFRLNRHHRHGITWHQMRAEAVVASRCDVFMVESRRDFVNCQIRTPRGFDTDHEALCAWMQAGPAKRHSGYLNARKSNPWRPPENRTESDTLFDTLVQRVEKAKSTPRVDRKSWISDDTWRLVDRRAQGKRQGTLSQEELRALNQQIHSSLKKDRKKRVTDAGTAIEAALEANDLQAAWNIAKAWYAKASGTTPRPSKSEFQALHEERSELYRARPSPGDGIPLHVDPFDVPDEVPSQDEIATATRQLRTGRAGGASGMKPEHLRQWLEEFEREDGDKDPWQAVLDIVQRAFVHGELPSAFELSVLVIIPKPCGGVRGIGLLEAIWKLIERIITNRLNASISLHDGLHGFRQKRGCGTAILECKLEQEQAIFKGETLFQVFLDLSKAYDTLDRDRTLEILEGYGVGPNVLRILHTFWDKLVLIPRQSGYYGRELIDSQRGVTQGGIASPIIFNIVIDAILRAWLEISPPTVRAAYYADDGRLAGPNDADLQQSLEIKRDLFERVGLKMNAIKTKAMIGCGSTLGSRLTTPVYKRRLSGVGLSQAQAKRRKVACPQCDRQVQARHLARHILSQHGDLNRPAKRRRLLDEANRAPITYYVYSDRYQQPLDCPVPDCPGHVLSRDAMRSHFAFRHPRDRICIHPEGLLPRCVECGMQVNQTRQHRDSKRCQKGRVRKRRREREIQNIRDQEATFTVQGSTLDNVDTFLYLGRVIACDDTDWPAVQKNLSKARKRWAQFSRLLRREGANPRVSGLFYKAAVMSVLLYGSETWVISKPILTALDGFHHRCARSITKRHFRYFPEEDRWEHPPVTATLEAAGLFNIEKYLARRLRYLLEYAKDRPLVQECLDLHSGDGAASASRVFWWDREYGVTED